MALAVVVAGCGGGGSQSQLGESTGSLTLRVVWPPLTAGVLPQLVPAHSRSVVVTIVDDDLILAARTVVRPDSPPWTTEITIEGLAACDGAILTATARPNDDGSGVAQAEGSMRVVIPVAGAAYPADGSPGDDIVLNMASTIMEVAIGPSAATVRVGETLQLTATAKNAQGQTVLVPPQNTFEWSVVGATAHIIVQSASVSVDNNGLVEGLSPGVARVQATEPESGISGTITVEVTQQPTAGDSLEVSMNLDFSGVVGDPSIWDIDRLEQEIEQMMADSAAAGVDRILFRVTSTGEVLYLSDVMSTYDGEWDPIASERIIRAVESDGFGMCVRHAHAYGMEIWAWINIFDRGYSAGGAWDHFLADHPQYWWTHRDGQLYWFGMPCYAYEQVRARQVAGVAEIAARYDTDGFFFDFRKHGGVDSGTGSPNFDYGFNAPVIQEYISRWGEDPRQVVDGPESEAGRRFSQLKADHFTQLMREIRPATGGLPIMLAYGFQTCDIASGFAYVDTRVIFDENLADEICLWRRSRRDGLAAAGKPVGTTGWYRIYDWAGEWTRDQKVAEIDKAVQWALQDAQEGITFHEQYHFEQHDLYPDLRRILDELL